jgi:WS/DGAT/MGAT family acyltransferase
MKQLTGPDAMYLYTELDGFPMHIGGVSIYDQSTSPGGKVRFRDILAMFEGRLDRSPIFRRRLAEVPFTLDKPYWVDDENFDLEFHLRHIALPKPGDWRQLCIQVARLHARPLDRARPLWEAYIIEGLNNVEGVPEGSFALYTKVHHSAIDGHSGMQFFGAFNDITPDPPEAEPAAAWQPRRYPSNSRLLRKAYWHNLRKPSELISLGRKMLASRKRVKLGLEHGDFHEPGDVPSTRFNGRLSPHRVVDAAKFDFQAIRKIKQAVPGATINDAVLAIVSGGLRKYLQARQDLPEQPLVSGCPVNLREEGDGDADNMVGMMTVSLCTDVDQPLQRLQAVHQETQSAKAYVKAQGSKLALEFMDTVPSAVQALLVQAASLGGMAERNPMTNTMITNVPGSPYQLYMCGAQIVDSFGIGPLSPGIGLFHTVNSSVMNNKGVITLAFVSCRDVMPDPAFYTQCLNESFAELSAACNKPAAKRTTVKRPAAGKNRQGKKGA